MKMSVIDHINTHPDLTAIDRGDRIEIKIFGKPAGYITHDDIRQAEISISPTGWPQSKGLRKGALHVYRMIRGE